MIVRAASWLISKEYPELDLVLSSLVFRSACKHLFHYMDKRHGYMNLFTSIDENDNPY